MESIKTSKSATHFCRLQASGALDHACKTQCLLCKDRRMKHIASIKILQSRGIHNNPTEYNEQIVQLVRSNLYKIQERTAKKPKVKSLKNLHYVEAV